MKTNTKGFTLIELLAVIVILAIIALIASPIILGIIQNARESSMARSVENFASAVNTAITSVMYDTNYGGGDVTVDKNTGKATAAGAAEGTTVEKEPSYSGSKVTCTSIEYDVKTGYLKMSGCSVGGTESVTFKYDNTPKTGTNGAAVKEASE